jgi:tRNA modification GTPase
VLSSQNRSLREELLGIMARIEAAIDFPEDVEEIRLESVAASLHDAISHVSGLLDTAGCGKVYREGIQAVIVGRPNVGKSSLLNALVRESRAIVTPIPGTTRDLIEETINIRGIPVRTIDTAGVRATSSIVEKAGIDRTRRTVEQADLILAMLDASRGLSKGDKELLTELHGRKLIVVVNKTDLLREDDAREMLDKVRGWIEKNLAADPPLIGTAAPSNEGITELEDLIVEMVMAGGVACAEGAVVSNVRHSRALEEARLSLQHCLRTVESNLPLDFISIDLRAAVDALGKITGETATEDVIDRIFSDFCIGK